MLELKFKNPEFREGKNTTVRKGSKYNIREKDNNTPGTSGLVRLVDADSGEKIGMGHITETYLRLFEELRSTDIICEHDHECTTMEGLYKTLVKHYRGLTKKSLVTVIHFDYHHDTQRVE